MDWVKGGRLLRLAAWAAVLLGLLCASGLGEEELYKENRWNFVDGSMDVSQGIPESAGGTLERVRLSGKLRVATEPYFPPQEFIDPALEGQAQYVGADMNLARLIAERMGVELEIVPMEFTEVLPAVEDGICDLAISALAYTPGRAGRVTLSKGYYFSEDNAGNGILIRAADAEAIHGLDDLANRVIVAQSGSLQEALTAENVLFYLEFRRLPSTQDVYDALEAGRADAGTVNVETALAYLESNPDCGLMLLPGVLFQMDPQYEGDRIAGPKGDLALMYFVNGVIDEVLQDGLYRQWYDSAEEYARTLGL